MRDLIDASTNQLKSSRLHLYSKMEGMDRLLVNSLSESIRSELTDEKVSRLEKKIAEDFGLGFSIIGILLVFSSFIFLIT